MFHLLVLSISTWLRPPSDVQLLNEPRDIARLIFELLTMLACFVVLVTYIQEVRFFGLYYAISNLVSRYVHHRIIVN